MFRKILFTFCIALILILLFIISKKDTIITAFRLSDEPIVISKGNYGQSLIVEISFSHDGLKEWIEQLEKPYPLFMLDVNWIERSPEMVELIKKKNIPTGIYGNNHGSEFSIDLFKKEIEIYEETFHNKPLWYMSSNYDYPQSLKQAAFNEKINLLSPTFIFSEKTSHSQQNNEGAIISVQIHETSNPNFNNVTKLLKKQNFISIEENIFGYSMKSKRIP